MRRDEIYITQEVEVSISRDEAMKQLGLSDRMPLKEPSILVLQRAALDLRSCGKFGTAAALEDIIREL